MRCTSGKSDCSCESSLTWLKKYALPSMVVPRSICSCETCHASQVDIDLTYLPIAPRDESLAAIDSAMKRIAQRIRTSLGGAQITVSVTTPENAVIKLLVRHDGAQVKIEVTPVLRGCVFEPEIRPVAASVEEEFGFAEIQVVSFADLYAGKIVAALDRQHPRDFFDVRDLLANEGVNDDLRNAFIVYLISHNRPMAEVLSPQRKPIETDFLRGFEGMTQSPVRVQELEEAREDLLAAVVGRMPEPHRRFLLSLNGANRTGSFSAFPVHVICLPCSGGDATSINSRPRIARDLLGIWRPSSFRSALRGIQIHKSQIKRSIGFYANSQTRNLQLPRRQEHLSRFRRAYTLRGHEQRWQVDYL